MEEDAICEPHEVTVLTNDRFTEWEGGTIDYLHVGRSDSAADYACGRGMLRRVII